MDRQIKDPSDIPPDMSEEQARRFWDTHEVTEEYLSKVETLPHEDYESRSPRTRPISVRLEEDALLRLKKLAHIKKEGYQTLLKRFVSERLDEEELALESEPVTLSDRERHRTRVPVVTIAPKPYNTYVVGELGSAPLEAKLLKTFALFKEDSTMIPTPQALDPGEAGLGFSMWSPNPEPDPEEL